MTRTLEDLLLRSEELGECIFAILQPETYRLFLCSVWLMRDQLKTFSGNHAYGRNKLAISGTRDAVCSEEKGESGSNGTRPTRDCEH